MADRFSADHRALRFGEDMGVGALRGVNALRDLVHLRLDCPLIGTVAHVRSRGALAAPYRASQAYTKLAPRPIRPLWLESDCLSKRCNQAAMRWPRTDIRIALR